MSSTDFTRNLQEIDAFTRKLQEINIDNYNASQSDHEFEKKVREINSLIEQYRKAHEGSAGALDMAFIRHVAQILSVYSKLLKSFRDFPGAIISVTNLNNKNVNIINYNALNDDDNKRVKPIVRVLAFLSHIHLSLKVYNSEIRIEENRIDVNSTNAIIDKFCIESPIDLRIFTRESVGGIRKNRIRKTSKKNKKRRKSYIRRRRRRS
jgi:hypothetical protein